MTRASGIVEVDNHSFFLATEGQMPAVGDELSNGLVDVYEYGASMITGIAAGSSTVSVDILEAEPQIEDTSQAWEEIVEVSIPVTSARLCVRSLDDTGVSPLVGLVVDVGSGWLRLRAHAVGRDIEFDGVAWVPVETYLLQLWPTVSMATETIRRQTDTTGRNLRRRRAQKLARGL